MLFVKFFSSILANRLQTWADENRLLLDTQAGFRRGFSTIDNILIMDTIVQKAISVQQGLLYGIYVDFERAFDSVDRGKLWLKMSKLGVNPEMVKMLKEIYRKVEACVKIDSHRVTETFKSTLGVRQGDNLSGVCFIIFLNDLGDYLLSHGAEPVVIGQLYVSILLFADDLSILAKTARGLQMKINILYRYCQEFSLKINLAKTKIVVFRKYLQRKVDYRWYLNGESIEVVEQYNYLGLTYRANGCWTEAKLELARRGSRALNMMLANMKKFGYLEPRIMLKMFDSKIVPILTYGSELWGFSGTAEIELIASNFYRRILGLRRNAPVTLARGELGRHELSTMIMMRIIKYWLKLVRSPNDRAVYKCYEYQRIKCENNQECWALNVKALLFSLGFDDVWLNQSPGHLNRFITEFSKRCKNMSIVNWHDKVASFGSLRTYNTIKSNFSLEWFLTIDLSKHVINNLVRLRGGLLRIAANEGRWTNIALEQRICPMCNRNEIEDEHHLIFKCRAWSTFRQNLICFPPFNNHSLCVIFAVKDRNLLLELSRYIIAVIEIREDILRVL